ncbi:hypothetical protein FOIG_03056 [Fusarium odoratissimum NRRL 54006]|uniref:Uncharacterized protein n=2 Tax=Fusarium oxysporum species complex TaxID=171631 RepID=X0K4B1_FUSO5|nr:uncharacterized protein FOIG_03056 [Fusarium odoratissimum NRRL 54006]EXM08369.1 hypothetical protein FOIG_03056 [Fusarium odoratissimum NRRL 54006]TXC10070.1 hypothetical protein FocTR4_00005146 [Fusarium oxysporum f. sp. cubense]
MPMNDNGGKACLMNTRVSTSRCYWCLEPEALRQPATRCLFFIFIKSRNGRSIHAHCRGYLQPSTPKQVNACVRSSGIYLPINAFQLNHSGLTRFCAIDLHRPSKGLHYSTARPQDHRLQPH